jgi:hypothetical protein
MDRNRTPKHDSTGLQNAMPKPPGKSSLECPHQNMSSRLNLAHHPIWRSRSSGNRPVVRGRAGRLRQCSRSTMVHA